MIEVRTQPVYYSSAANKTYITKKGASVAEAKALILKKYPTEPYESDTGAGWFWLADLPNADKLLRRYARLIRRSINPPHRVEGE